MNRKFTHYDRKTAFMTGGASGKGATMMAYAATKSAVVSLLMALRPAAARLRISVSVLSTGAIKAPILEGGRINGRMVTAIAPEQQLALIESLGSNNR